MIKTTEAELAAFWADTSWLGDDCHVDGEQVHIGDTTTQLDLLDASSVRVARLDGGVVCCQAAGDRTRVSLETVFRKWRKAQTMATVVVQVPRERLDDLRAAIKAVGGTVL